MESNSDSEKEPVKPAPKVTANSAANKEERSSDDPESSQPPLTNLMWIKKRPKKLKNFNFRGGEYIFLFTNFLKTCLKSVLGHSKSF